MVYEYYSLNNRHLVLALCGFDLHGLHLRNFLLVYVYVYVGFVMSCEKSPKCQLISKGLFGVIFWTKKPTKKKLRISALASKKSSNQKTLLYNYVK